jgi:hypothetical protein
MPDLTIKRFYVTTLFLTGSFLLIAQAPSSRAYQIKAAFLFNFSQFVEWPPEAFTSDKQPLVIGVLGADPFGTSLEAITHNEIVNGHPLAIARFATVDEVKDCHILFVNMRRTEITDEALLKLKQRSILTVGDSPGFIRQGGIIRFVMEDNKIKLQINPEAAKTSGLTISSKLLSLADIIIYKE